MNQRNKMQEKLTRYELGIINEMHDKAHYTCINQKYLAQRLNRLNLPLNVSRFNLAQHIKEIETRIGYL